MSPFKRSFTNLLPDALTLLDWFKNSMIQANTSTFHYMASDNHKTQLTLNDKTVLNIAI